LSDTPGQLAALPAGSIDAVVSSPPFSDTAHSDWHIDSSPGRLKALYENYRRNGGGMTEEQFRKHCESRQGGYGATNGNLAVLPTGKVDAVVSSPPFSDCERGGTGVCKHPEGCSCNWCLKNRGNAGSIQGGKWGEAAAENLGTLPAGEVADAIVSSPPYEGSEGTPSLGSVNKDNWGKEGTDICARRGLSADYGQTSGQVGHTTGETFWSAAAVIVAECHQILRPGGVAIFVVKDFVRKGKRVPFSDDWQRLCEAAGFRLLCRHRAMLVKVHGRQKLIDGGEETKTTSRKSFFRRLAEAKGSPKIDWEDVLCLRKELP